MIYKIKKLKDSFNDLNFIEGYEFAEAKKEDRLNWFDNEIDTIKRQFINKDFGYANNIPEIKELNDNEKTKNVVGFYHCPHDKKGSDKYDLVIYYDSVKDKKYILTKDEYMENPPAAFEKGYWNWAFDNIDYRGLAQLGFDLDEIEQAIYKDITTKKIDELTNKAINIVKKEVKAKVQEDKNFANKSVPTQNIEINKRLQSPEYQEEIEDIVDELIDEEVVKQIDTVYDFMESDDFKEGKADYTNNLKEYTRYRVHNNIYTERQKALLRKKIKNYIEATSSESDTEAQKEADYNIVLKPYHITSEQSIKSWINNVDNGIAKGLYFVYMNGKPNAVKSSITAEYNLNNYDEIELAEILKEKFNMNVERIVSYKELKEYCESVANRYNVPYERVAEKMVEYMQFGNDSLPRQYEKLQRETASNPPDTNRLFAADSKYEWLDKTPNTPQLNDSCVENLKSLCDRKNIDYKKVFADLDEEYKKSNDLLDSYEKIYNKIIKEM